MSKSYRKPYTHWCHHDTRDKMYANQKFRSVCKRLLKKGAEILPQYLKEVSNIYTWSCDGKQYYYPEGGKKIRRK